MRLQDMHIKGDWHMAKATINLQTLLFCLMCHLWGPSNYATLVQLCNYRYLCKQGKFKLSCLFTCIDFLFCLRHRAFKVLQDQKETLGKRGPMGHR